jgi:hypothetical protein
MYRLALWGLAYVGFALVWGITQGPFNQIETHQTGTSTAATNGASYVTAAWDWAPLWVAVLLLIGLLSDALVERGAV